jgi:diacylglycerol kinase family enzyme
MFRIGIISNPFAKINKLNPNYSTRLWYCLANQGQLEVTHSVKHLHQVCQDFSAKNIDLVGIVGGDGSMSLALSALHHAYGEKKLPKILVLKGGTINFIAKNLGIKSAAHICLQDTLKLLRNKQTMNEAQLSTLQVNGRLGFIFAHGIATTFLEEFYKNKSHSAGAAMKLVGYLIDGLFSGKISGKSHSFMKPYKMKITTYPHPLWNDSTKNLKNPEEYSLVFASTVPHLPFTVRFFKKVLMGDKYGEMLAVVTKGKKLIQGVFKVLFGANIQHLLEVSSVKFQKAHINCRQHTSYSLDGEIIVSSDGNINIEMGPNFVFCSPYHIAH